MVTKSVSNQNILLGAIRTWLIKHGGQKDRARHMLETRRDKPDRPPGFALCSLAVQQFFIKLPTHTLAAVWLAALPYGSVGAAEQETLSALAAQAATRRFDSEISFLENEQSEQLSWAFQYTSVVKKKHQLTAVLPLVDPDAGNRLSLRNGDLTLGYSYTFQQEITANPWVPSNIGTGIGISLPTGDLGDGTGSGSYIVAPRLGYVAKLGRSMALLPSLEYRRSFASEHGAIDVKSIAGALPLFYVNRNAFWINLSPLYFRDISHGLDAPGASIIVGKLFLKHLAVSLTYSWLPSFSVDDTGDSRTEYDSSLIFGFHIPFSYSAK